MSIDILHQHTNTLPSGFKVTFTVGRIVKDKPNSLPPLPSQAADTSVATLLPATEDQSPANPRYAGKGAS